MAAEPVRKRSDSAIKLGAALRVLRKKAGLKQAEVARLMGKTGRGADTTVSRLERGYFEQPRKDTMARYARACGAEPEDVAKILRMTGFPPETAEPKRQAASPPPSPQDGEGAEAGSKQPTADSSQLQSTDEREKAPAKARKERTKEQKPAQIERKAGRLVSRAMLESVLYDMLKSGLPPEAMAEQKALAEHGRKTFELLARTHQTRLRLRKKTLECPGVSAVQAEQMEEVVGRLFGAMEQSGDLERKPAFDPEQVLAGKQKLVPARKAEERIADELRQELEAWGQSRNKVRQQIRTECVNLMTEQGVPDQEAGRLSRYVAMFSGIAEENPDAQERQRRAQDFASRARTEETKQRLLYLAEYVFRRWDELKGTIPERPRALQGKRG